MEFAQDPLRPSPSGQTESPRRRLRPSSAPVATSKTIPTPSGSRIWRHDGQPVSTPPVRMAPITATLLPSLQAQYQMEQVVSAGVTDSKAKSDIDLPRHLLSFTTKLQITENLPPASSPRRRRIPTGQRQFGEKFVDGFFFFFFLSLVSRSRLIEKEMSEKARIIQDLKLLGASSATVDATGTGNPRIQEFPEGHAPAADRPSSLHHTQSQRAPQHHQNHHQRSVPPVLLDYETSPGRGSTDDVLMRDAQQRFLLPMEGSPSDWRRPS